MSIKGMHFRNQYMTCVTFNKSVASYPVPFHQQAQSHSTNKLVSPSHWATSTIPFSGS